jgi:hypothetical protein
MSALAILHVSLREVHAVITSLMFKEMILAREAVITLAATVSDVAVNEFDLVSRDEVAGDICFAREGGNATFPVACYPFFTVSEMLLGQAHVS